MQTLNQPSLLLKPFAEQGDKNTIPNVNTDPTEPQKADFTSGFPAIVSLPPDQGGLPPERKDFNALGYLTTLYDFFYQAGGTFTFDPTTSTAIGGYPIGARLWYTDSDGVSMILRSTIQNNTNNFLTDSTVIGQVGENKPWVVENFMGIKSQLPLFAFNWYDHEPNDGSWLSADTWSWQDGTIYQSAYQALADAQSTGTQSSDLWTNYNVVGNPTITNGVVSNFSTSNYITSSIPFAPGSSPWETITKVNWNGNASLTGFILGGNPLEYGYTVSIRPNSGGKLGVYLSSNGTSWNIASNTQGTNAMPANQDIWVRFGWSGTEYYVDFSTDGETYTRDITISSTLQVYQNNQQIVYGHHSSISEFWQGTMDLTQTSYSVDGLNVWQGAVNVPYTRATNGWKIVSSANAGYVQDMYESTGVAWYYVLDTANTQFKLPRTKYGFVGLRDSVGNYVPETLPNIKGGITSDQSNRAYRGDTGTGALYTEDGSAFTGTSNADIRSCGIFLDASLSSSTYQDNAPVQQRATQMYLYFYVGNTIRSQSEIDVGAITEALNNKWDSANMKVVSELPENPQTGVFYFVT